MILDKSYVKSVKASEIEALSENNDLFLTVAFLYEVLKSEDKERSVFWKKLSNSRGDPIYKVLPSVYLMLLHEVNENEPTCNDIASYIGPRDYSIHKLLADEDYRFTEEEKTKIKEQKGFVNKGAQSLFCHINLYKKMYCFLMSEAKLKGVEPEKFLISDFSVKYIGFLMKLEFDKEMERERKSERFPEIESLDESWFLYKFIQVHNLVSYNIISRYSDLGILLETENAFEKLRHDYLDIEYLLWAISFKEFKTKENKLDRWFSLLK